MSNENTKSKPENGLLSLFFNVLIPALFLSKASERLGPVPTLFIALAFPLFYGLHDLWKKRKWNALSILGFTNVLVTGGLAIMGLGGIWFAIKEAFFPFLIGVFIWLSARKDSPLVKTFLLNPHTIHTDVIDLKLKEAQKEAEFLSLMQFSTKLLACSFFISSLLNFLLALHVFTPLNEAGDATAKSIELNQQIGQMTSYSAIVIVLPSTIFLIGILWHLLSGIKKLTGLNTDQILKG
jgi:hypothetical protein